MSFLDTLRAERTAPPAIWIQFTTCYRAGHMDLYVFMEGSDDPSFYLPEIRRRWSKGELKWFVCKGKGIVLGLMAQVQPRLDHQWRALFFVDKDVDDFVGTAPATQPCLYQTDHYSIENYLVAEDMLKAVWAELFHLATEDRRLATVIGQFHQAQRDFVDALRLLMAVVIYYRRKGERPLLSDVNLEKVVEFDTNFRITRLPDWFIHFQQVAQVSPAPDWTEIGNIERDLATRNHKVYLRGKYELWFFVNFVVRVANVVGERTGSVRAVIHTHLTTANAVEILAPRITVPNTLAAFLSSLLDGK